MLSEKNWEGLVHSLYLNVGNMYFTTLNVASTSLNLNKKSGKKRRNVNNTSDLSDRKFKGDQ